MEERSRPLHPTLTLLPCGPMWRLTADRNLLFISEETQQTNGIRSQSGGGHCPRSLGQGGWDPKPVCVCGFVPGTRSGSAFQHGGPLGGGTGGTGKRWLCFPVSRLMMLLS